MYNCICTNTEERKKIYSVRRYAHLYVYECVHLYLDMYIYIWFQFGLTREANEYP